MKHHIHLSIPTRHNNFGRLIACRHNRLRPGHSGRLVQQDPLIGGKIIGYIYKYVQKNTRTDKKALTRHVQHSCITLGGGGSTAQSQ